MKRLVPIVLGLAFLVSACSKPTNTAIDTAGTSRVNSFTIPHVLRYTDNEDINTLNPLLFQSASLAYMASMTMAWLIKWGPDNKPYGELATEVPSKKNGGVSPNGLTITYHLRKGVKWSDGVPFTADDVIWTYHAIMNPANNITSRLGWDDIVAADAPDKNTVVFHLKKPFSPFVEIFFSSEGANPCILPKHLLAQFPNINHVAYNALPVGIGPFKYQEWDRAQKVVMVANPLYFRGLPKLKKVIYEIIPDRNTVLTQLQATGLDMWVLMTGNYIDKAKAITPYRVASVPSFLFDHMDFNLTSPKLKDPAVREALRYAIDRATLISKISHGVGDVQEQPAPKTAAYYDPSIANIPFDIAKANQILDAAGWKRGADGIRAKNGVKLNLDLATVSGSQDTDEKIELIRNTWEQIGVSIDVRHYSTPVIFGLYAEGGIIYTGKFDVVMFAWVNDAIGDYSQIYACNQIPPAGQNDLHWCNQKAQAAMDNLYTQYEQPGRNKDTAIVMKELIKDVPTVVLDARQDLYVENRDLKNFNPNGVTQFDNMMNVDI